MRVESALITQMLAETRQLSWTCDEHGGAELLRLLQSGKRIRIAGPCALQSEEQIRAIVAEIGDVTDVFRVPDKKPRTRPVDDLGRELFLGIGHEASLPIYEGLRADGHLLAVEVMNGDDVHALHGVLALPWIGSRNTDQGNARRIGKAMAECRMPGMVKNPLVPDLQMYLGMLENTILGSDRKVPIIACIRGLFPYEESDKRQWRNVPNLEWITELSAAFPGLPIIVDGSHMIHRQDPNPLLKLANIINEAFDRGAIGYMTEVHNAAHPSVTDIGVPDAGFAELVEEMRW